MVAGLVAMLAACIILLPISPNRDAQLGPINLRLRMLRCEAAAHVEDCLAVWEAPATSQGVVERASQWAFWPATTVHQAC